MILCNHQSDVQSVTIFIQLKYTEHICNFMYIQESIAQLYIKNSHTPNMSHELHIKDIKISGCVCQYKPYIILERFTF